MKIKKSLGQNFLINPKVAERIVAEANISKKDTVLEIGPGTGNLTKFLLAKAKKVIAVEKDNNLISLLKIKFAEEIKNQTFILMNDDILKFNVNQTILKFFSGPRLSGSLPQPDHSKNLKLFDLKAGQNILERTLGRSDGDGQRKFSVENFRGESENILPSFQKYKIVANIPYNITGAILKKFLTEKNKPKSMTLMLQKEVAERIVARDKKESLLSISVKVYGEPEILFKVGRGNFHPAPNVDSTVLAIKNISDDIFKKNKIDQNKFWKIVKAGFAHKRKKLSGNLKNIIPSQDPTLTFWENKRAEDLTLSDWILLAKS